MSVVALRTGADAVAQVPLFSSLSLHEVQSLAAQMVERCYIHFENTILIPRAIGPDAALG